MNIFFEECIKEANIAYSNGDVPIGSIIVFNNEIIGRGHNNRLLSKDVTDHAEVIAIREASKYINDWRLDNCDLYVTLEPCHMCTEIIRESRIKNVYYLISKDSYKHPFNGTKFNLYSDESFQQKIDEYKDKLSKFFTINCNR
jgi:tRNA(adenine34) deaminase